MKKLYATNLMMCLFLIHTSLQAQDVSNLPADSLVMLKVENEMLKKQSKETEIESTETIENLKSTITLLKQENIDCEERKELELKKKQEEVDKLKSENEALEDLIDRTVIPTALYYKDHNITHKNAIFLIGTDKTCRLKFTVKHTNGNIVYEKTSEFEGKDVYFTTRNLAPETDYQLEVDVLDLAGNKIPGKHFDYNNYPKFKFRTAKDPQIQITNFEVNAYDDNINVRVNTNKEYLVKVKCYRNSNASVNVERVRSQGNTLSQNRLKEFEEPMRKGESGFTFPSLSFGEEYVVEIEVVNKYGEKISRSKTVKTDANGFDFNGPIAFNLNTLNSQIRWKANGVLRSGKVRIFNSVSSQRYFTDELKPSAQNEFISNLDYDDIVKILRGKEEDGVPIIEVSMTDKYGKSKKLSTTIDFSIPSKKEVEEAHKKELINDNQKDHILKVIDGYKNGKKFKWEDIVTTGLPLILSFL